MFVLRCAKVFHNLGGAQKKKIEVCPPSNSFLRPPLGKRQIRVAGDNLTWLEGDKLQKINLKPVGISRLDILSFH
jgi:hypothetical protein